MRKDIKVPKLNEIEEAIKKSFNPFFHCYLDEWVGLEELLNLSGFAYYKAIRQDGDFWENFLDALFNELTEPPYALKFYPEDCKECCDLIYSDDCRKLDPEVVEILKEAGLCSFDKNGLPVFVADEATPCNIASLFLASAYSLELDDLLIRVKRFLGEVQ